jgi:hypothetical protein
MNFHKERKYPEKFYPSPVYEESEYKILDDKYNHLQYINAGKGHATNFIAPMQFSFAKLTNYKNWNSDSNCHACLC